MQIKTLTLGMIETNCYIISDNDCAMVIDPACDGEKIADYLTQNNLLLKYIVITHRHFDHTGALLFLVSMYPDAIVVINEQEYKTLDEFGTKREFASTPIKNIQFVKENDILKLDTEELSVIDTPGHTAGGICLKSNDILFSGDTLFKDTIGRCDLPSGDLKMMVSSVMQKLFTLPENTKVYPGHGAATTIGYEKNNNEIYNWM